MRIKALHFRNFRGLQSTGLPSCSGFNVLIGKNNAGKSSILAGLELVLEHLEKGRFSFRKDTDRPHDQFTHRDFGRGFQIGLQIEVPSQDLEDIKADISEQIPSLERAISTLDSDALSFIFEGLVLDGHLHTYLSILGFGELDASKPSLRIDENVLLSVPKKAATELVRRDQEAANIATSLEEIDPAIAEIPSWEYIARDQARTYGTKIRSLGAVGDQIIEAARGVTTKADFDSAIAGVKSSLEHRIEELEKQESSTPFDVFGGTVKLIPSYIYSVLNKVAAKNIVHFRETRAAIGYEEAAQLLQLKTRRGGAERLATVQTTVKSLLGVNVDAFEPELGEARRPRLYARRSAEMDVDNFLVEANGAGIREALRIVLDIELKNPDVVLIEEPEVHLHPGLERSLHSYLVSKKEDSQIFVSTHSTNFIDVSDIQSVFVLSRNDKKISQIEQISSKEDLLRVPEEIGLRPSTILMFDRLIFVEGPSDEAILSQLATTCGLDLLQIGATFVKMGGSSALPHYAAEATLDLLSRRQIPMWFVIDRDEQADEEVQKILKRLGNRAHAVTLPKRELENYLLNADAISRAMAEKARHSEVELAELPDSLAVAKQLEEIASGLKEEVKRLTVERRVLRPVYPAKEKGDAKEKIAQCQSRLTEIAASAEQEIAKIHSDIDERWPKEMMSMVPGSRVLEGVYSAYGLKYDKIKDGRRLAATISANSIDVELVELIKSLTRP